jgi:DNA polymerase-1
MPYVKEQLIELGDMSMTLHCEIRKYAGDLNPNSPKQLIEYFATVGIETESVNKDALSEIDHPVAKLVLELRTVNKLRQTYFLALHDEAEDYGFYHILHPSFRQHGTVTGRMSSGAAQR